jgi:putative ABC transport system substrate-binding protein
MGSVRRRQILVAAGALLVSRFARSQVAGRARRVAFVLTTSPLAEMAGPEPAHRPFRAFLHELRARGWMEGRNLVLERRSAEGKFERAPAIFSELAQSGVEVIVTVSNSFAKAAMKAAPSVPIVTSAASPVESGLVKSLARPGGNLTGVTSDVGPEFHGKLVELVKDALPRAKSVAFLRPRGAEEGGIATKAVHGAARILGLDLFDAEWTDNAIDAAFKLIEGKRGDALLVHPHAAHWARRTLIVEFARKMRLPDFYGWREAVEIGGLCSYGIYVDDLFSKLAVYVDRILKGAKPGDLPIERPTRFETVINLKTARLLGIKFPPMVLARADQVIE